MRFLGLLILQFVALTAFADTAKIKLNQDQIAEISFDGEYGGVTHSLFNFVEHFYASALNPQLKSEYNTSQYRAEQWSKYPDAMDGDGYKFIASIDGVKNQAFSINNDAIVIEGEIAETLLSGMWNMYRSYENNFTVGRGGTHGDITMIDLFSNGIVCSLESRFVDHLSKRFATCTVQVEVIK